MQRELPTIDFATQAEVRLEAEHRRTEEVAGLLRSLFGEWLVRFRALEHPVLQAVRHSHRTVTGGKSVSAIWSRLMWRFKRPHHYRREFIMRTSEPKPH